MPSDSIGQNFFTIYPVQDFSGVLHLGMEKNEMKKQTSQEWEIARYNREAKKWADRKARWNDWKNARPTIMVCQNTISK